MAEFRVSKGQSDKVANKTRAQLQAELHALRKARTVDGWVIIGQSLIRWAALVTISWFGYLSIAALAGTTTLAEIGIGFFGHFKISITLAWIFGIVGLGYGYQQRELRRSTVERLQSRIQSLEQKIDSGRSSSLLTKRGSSRPEDET